MRNFLTDAELSKFKLWIADNGFQWQEDPEEGILFTVRDGRFDFYITETTEAELFEIFSRNNHIEELLEKFYRGGRYLHGIEVPKKKITAFVPEDMHEYLSMFDHFRMCQRIDNLWDLLGVVGFHEERLAICKHKLPLKVLGTNFLEHYWTLVYTSKKERRDYATRLPK